MAKVPNDRVIRILRQIQGTLAEHGRILAEHTRRFETLERSAREVRESTIAALGLAGHANVRTESVERRLDE